MSKAAAHIERQSVYIPSRGVMLEADLVVPDGVHGIVAFAHRGGSSRHSRRNRYVAEVLQGARLATLLLDLLTPAEEAIDIETMELRCDIDLLADRVAWTVDWLANNPGTGRLRIRLFGASIGWPPWSRRRRIRTWSMRWCTVAAGPTWPPPPCPRCARRLF